MQQPLKLRRSWRRRLLASTSTIVVFGLVSAAPAAAQDAELAPEAVQNILDNIWVLIAGVLVFFMQAGFALVEGGLTRSKNVANIMMKNLMDGAAGVLAFYVIGYSIAYKGTGSWISMDGLGPFSPGDYEGTGLTPSVDFFFQAAFAATAATIVSGAMAERTVFKSYFIYSIVITALIYPVVVGWTWGGGWLAELSTPFSDFAGSSIVHSVGGWAAMMGALILGPRIGKYGPNGEVRAIPGHSIPMVILGAFILFVCWFGFNGGSELAADLAVPDIALTTLLAAMAGAVAAMITVWIWTGKPDVGMTANGLLAGLVSITAPCGAVSNNAAILIGAIGGVLVVAAVFFFDRVVKIDDPVGAISVHGVCGVWGTLAVGLFASKPDGFLATNEAGELIAGGLFYGHGASQLGTQALMALSVFLWTAVVAGLVFLAIKHTIGLRVTEAEELAGLDVLEHGSPGYGEGFGTFHPVSVPAENA